MIKQLNKAIVTRFLNITGTYVQHRFYIDVPIAKVFLLSDPKQKPVKEVKAGEVAVVMPAAVIKPSRIIVRAVTNPKFTNFGGAPAFREYLPTDEEAALPFLFAPNADMSLDGIDYCVRIVVEDHIYPPWV